MSRQAGRIQHGREQRVFVFAVAILVAHHVARGMGLIPSLAQRKAHVTKILSYIFVERLNLFPVAGFSSNQFRSLRSNITVGNNSRFLKLSVPLAHFVPTLEGG